MAIPEGASLKEIIRLVVISVLSVAALAVLCFLYEYLVPADPNGLLRYLIFRLAAIAVCIPSIAGGWLLLDWITPHHWFDCEFTSYEKTLLHCVVVLAIAWILVSG